MIYVSPIYSRTVCSAMMCTCMVCPTVEVYQAEEVLEVYHVRSIMAYILKTEEGRKNSHAILNHTDFYPSLSTGDQEEMQREENKIFLATRLKKGIFTVLHSVIGNILLANWSKD